MKKQNKGEQKKSPQRRKRLTGVVISNKMENTVVVSVTMRKAHPLYKKVLMSTKKYKAHTGEKHEIGEEVVIEQTKPISKQKQWKVLEVVSQKKK